MQFVEETITAISTPIGQGGIGIVRLTGPQSIEIIRRIFRAGKEGTFGEAKSAAMRYGYIIDPSDGSEVDEVLVSVMRAPRSYTREDVVEVNCHGGMVTVRRVLEILLAQGARMAQPGEFTKRAFLNGRISLAQAEAVSDLITSRTVESMKIALEQLKGGLSTALEVLRSSLVELSALVEAHIDFPEEDLGEEDRGLMTDRLETVLQEIERLSRTFEEARFFREGLSVAIVGRPNVGKSSLLNALLKKDRAIVTDVPGTTRDVIEEYLNISGLPIRIIDTAGIRHAGDAVEKEGVRRSRAAIQEADFIIAMFDGSQPVQQEDYSLLREIEGKNAVLTINKSDLPQKISLETAALSGRQYIHISAATGLGLEELKGLLFNTHLKNWKEEREGVVVTNVRHKHALDRSGNALQAAVRNLQKGEPLEIVAIELRDAVERIGEITGAVTTDEILNKIFSDFCIGK